MKTLASCIKKAGKALSKSDIDFLNQSRQQYIDNGLNGTEAASRAAEDFVNFTHERVRQYETEIEERGGLTGYQDYNLETEINRTRGIEEPDVSRETFQQPIPILQEEIQSQVKPQLSQESIKQQPEIQLSLEDLDNKTKLDNLSKQEKTALKFIIAAANDNESNVKAVEAAAKLGIKTNNINDLRMLLNLPIREVSSDKASSVRVKITENNFDLKKQGYSNEEIEVINKGGFGRKTQPEGFKERFDNFKQDFKTKFRQETVDQFAAIKDKLGDDKAYMMSHLTASAPGGLEAAIKFGRPYLHKDGVIAVDTEKQSLQQLLEPLGDNLDKWTYWIAGNRADKLMAEGKENLFTVEDVEVLKGMNRGNEKLFEQVRVEFEKLNNAITQIAVDTGLVNAEEAQQWKDEGFYLPFYRVLDEEKSQGPKGLPKGGLVRQQAYKKLKGGQSKLNDLMTNVLLNWNHLLSASLKNQAAAKAIETAVELGVAERIVPAQKTKDSVYIRENGLEAWYDINEPLVLDSLMSLNWQGLDGRIMDSLRWFKRALTTGVTASPDFKVRNLVRDSIHAMAATDVSTNLVKNLYQGWKATAKDNDTAAQMLASGGSFGQSGYIHGSDPEAVKKLVKIHKSNEKNIKNTILDTPEKLKKVWQAYEDFGARLENINRAADYSQAIESGETRLKAAFRARDHLDFTRTGSSTFVRGVSQVIPFLNARMQGLDKLARSAPKTGRQWTNPKEAAKFKAVVGVYSLLSVGMYLAIKDDDDYKEAEEWEKRTYHLFKVPGSETMYRIPRPFEVGAIAYMAESVAQQMVDDKVHGQLFAERLGHTLYDTFSIDPIPQMFKPALEVAMNKNVFTGRKIESTGMERLSSKNRKKAWTSETAIALSEGMDKILWDEVVLSPVQIEHLVRGYFGWLGSTSLAATDMLITRPVSGAPSKPATKITEYPVIKSFVKAKPPLNTEYTTQFYNRLDEINTAYADIQMARQIGNLEEAKKLIEENKNNLALRKFYNKQSRELSKINKRMKQIRLSKMDSVKKRAELDRLTLVRNKITKMVAEVENKLKTP